MDMLIRTQNKRQLVDLQNITINIEEHDLCIYKDLSSKKFWCVEVEIEDKDKIKILGMYSTEEKAIRVLDMIEEEYQEPIYITDIGGEYAKYDHKVFHMPEDSEVIV